MKSNQLVVFYKFTRRQTGNFSGVLLANNGSKIPGLWAGAA